MKKHKNQRRQSLMLASILILILFGAVSSTFAQSKPCADKDYDCELVQDTKVINANPNSSDGYFGRANTYSLKEDYKNAIKDYTKAIELMNPPNAEIYSGRAEAYYELEKYDQAISDYTKAIAIDPTVADYYYYRGVAYHDKGNNSKAVDDYGQTLKLDPTFTDAKEGLEKIIAEETAKEEKKKRSREKWENFGKAVDKIVDDADAQSNKQTSTNNNGNTTNSGNTSNSSGSSLPAGTYACFTTVSIYAGRGGSGAYTYPIYNSSRQTRGSIRVQSDGTYRLDDGTMLHYSFNGSAIRWLDGTFAEASSSSLTSDNQGNTQILIKFNEDKYVWDCTKQ